MFIVAGIQNNNTNTKTTAEEIYLTTFTLDQRWNEDYSDSGEMRGEDLSMQTHKHTYTYEKLTNSCKLMPRINVDLGLYTNQAKSVDQFTKHLNIPRYSIPRMVFIKCGRWQFWSYTRLIHIADDMKNNVSILCIREKMSDSFARLPRKKFTANQFRLIQLDVKCGGIRYGKNCNGFINQLITWSVKRDCRIANYK